MDSGLFALDAFLLFTGVALAGAVWRWLGSLFVAMLFIMLPGIFFHAIVSIFPDLYYLICVMGKEGFI